MMALRTIVGFALFWMQSNSGHSSTTAVAPEHWLQSHSSRTPSFSIVVRRASCFLISAPNTEFSGCTQPLNSRCRRFLCSSSLICASSHLVWFAELLQVLQEL